MKIKYNQLIGKIYNYLTINEIVTITVSNKNRKYAICLCKCGKIKTIRLDQILCGDTTSCGCRYIELQVVKNNPDRVKIYKCWSHMIDRCYKPEDKSFCNYGERGISMIEDWKNNFENFYKWSIENGYIDGLTIERKDINKGYSPDNCTWITWKEQSYNRRTNVNIFAFGETKIALEWSKDNRCKIKYTTLLKRIKNGWNPELAITTPNTK